MTFRIEVGPADAGKRLDAFLGAHVGSRAQAAKLVEGGRVRVDGALPRAKRHAVSTGEVIEADLETTAPIADPAAGEGVPHAVVLEDEYLLVVDKPAGVVTHPAPGHPSGTLSQALALRGACGGEPWRPGIVHRLDRDTSGLLVVAKSDAVHRSLQALIRARRMSREYLALVEGRPDSRTGTIEAPIGRDRRDRTRHSTSTDHPRDARTHFEIEEELPRTTLLRVRLDSGRTHQIRVHLAAIGLPVVGDSLYGGGGAGERLALTRQFLHSNQLGFQHPVTGANLSCESKLPADLRLIYRAAKREPNSGRARPELI
ncbi:MAG: RluA family pseudouridine synthase [Thermoleophilaceae bacterium]|nr:RluA family pseudouridine synthase [Thermoleophilaceae bacterium]